MLVHEGLRHSSKEEVLESDGWPAPKKMPSRDIFWNLVMCVERDFFGPIVQ
jgi:hypothetical protein